MDMNLTKITKNRRIEYTMRRGGKNNVMLTAYFINPEITAHTEIMLQAISLITFF